MSTYENITIEQQSDFPHAQFQVRIGTGETSTVYTVTLAKDYWQELTGGDTSPSALVEKSFVFLLSREPKEAILSEFNLSQIEDYFPAYPKKVTEM